MYVIMIALNTSQEVMDESTTRRAGPSRGDGNLVFQTLEAPQESSGQDAVLCYNIRPCAPTRCHVMHQSTHH